MNPANHGFFAAAAIEDGLLPCLPSLALGGADCVRLRPPHKSTESRRFRHGRKQPSAHQAMRWRESPRRVAQCE
jgi:hypothetical protein